MKYEKKTWGWFCLCSRRVGRHYCLAANQNRVNIALKGLKLLKVALKQLILLILSFFNSRKSKLSAESKKIGQQTYNKQLIRVANLEMYVLHTSLWGEITEYKHWASTRPSHYLRDVFWNGTIVREFKRFHHLPDRLYFTVCWLHAHRRLHTLVHLCTKQTHLKSSVTSTFLMCEIFITIAMSISAHLKFATLKFY